MQVVAPYLDDATTLARWIAGNRADAEDIAQEAAIRALNSIGQFRGGSGRAWLLAIVRNTALTWLTRNRPKAMMSTIEDAEHDVADPAADPEASTIAKADAEMVQRAIAALPMSYREIIVLREMEQLSYQEIATVTGLPIGTVMSRLSRARGRLMALLAESGHGGDNVRAFKRAGEGKA